MLFTKNYIIIPTGHIVKVTDNEKLTGLVSSTYLRKFNFNEFKEFLESKTKYFNNHFVDKNTFFKQLFVKDGYVYGMHEYLEPERVVPFGTSIHVKLTNIISMTLEDLFNQYKSVPTVGSIKQFLDNFSCYKDLEEYLLSYNDEENVVMKISDQLPHYDSYRIMKDKNNIITVLSFDPLKEFLNIFSRIVKNPAKNQFRLQTSLSFSKSIYKNSLHDAIRIAAYEA